MYPPNPRWLKKRKAQSAHRISRVASLANGDGDRCFVAGSAACVTSCFFETTAAFPEELLLRFFAEEELIPADVFAVVFFVPVFVLFFDCVFVSVSGFFFTAFAAKIRPPFLCY